MIKFVFLLTVWTAESPVPAVYVVDSGLTADECVTHILDYTEGNPTHAHGIPSCEIDHASDLD